MPIRGSFPNLPGGEGIRLITSCPLCSTHYNFLEAKVLEARGDSHLLYLQCAKCFAAIVVLILMGELGMSSIGLVTDLTSDDVLRFKASESLTSDDILSLHNTLRRPTFLPSLEEELLLG